MSALETAKVLETVAASSLSTRRVLRELAVARSSYYRWRAHSRVPREANHPAVHGVPWNRPSRDEERRVLKLARASPGWSSRQLAAWITDNKDFSVSEATVCRILKSEGLVKRLEIPAPAGQEYRHKTLAPHRLWATDASYFRVAGWGYYYMVTVMDDFTSTSSVHRSRFILAWRLQVDSLVDRGGPGRSRHHRDGPRAGGGPDPVPL